MKKDKDKIQEPEARIQNKIVTRESYLGKIVSRLINILTTNLIGKLVIGQLENW